MKEKFDSNEYTFSDEGLERIIEIPNNSIRTHCAVMIDLSKK
ncbi:endonuclease [Helicobacter pylori]|nr:endonuclease [Helicobacter pylori]